MKLSHIKKIVKPFDLFSNGVSLRYDDQPEFQTATGGICSLILMVIFIAVFAGTLSNTLNRIYIVSTVTQFNDADPSYYNSSSDNFMFAIGLQGLDLNDGDRWFDIYMQFRSYNETQRNHSETVPLQRCQKEQWTNINQTYGQFYDKLALSKWLCPSKNTTLELQGKFTSQYFKFYRIGVRICTSSSNQTRPCVNSTVIQAFINANETFNFNFYFVNTIINAGGKQYISTFIDDFNYFPFSIKTGASANLFISSYTVTTDESILPYEDKIQVKGGIVLDNAQLLNYEVKKNVYLKFNIRKASLALDVQRSYRKADDTISYIGGLFSAIISALLLMGMYNEFCFELTIAKSLYKNQKDEKDQADSFNILHFMGYLIFMVFDKLSIVLPWKRMQKYHQSMVEIRKQMDIRLILHKVQFAERVANAVLEKHQIKGLHCQQYGTLDDAQKIREQYEFHDKLVKYYFEFLPEVERLNEKKEEHNQSIELNSTNHQIKINEDRKNQIVPEPNNFHRTNSLENSVQQMNTNLNRLDSLEQTKYELELKKQNNILEVEGAEEFVNINEVILEMKNFIVLLQKEEKGGNEVSKRILNAMDKRLVEKVISHKLQNKQPSPRSCSIKQADFKEQFPQQFPKAMESPNRKFLQRKLNSKLNHSNDLLKAQIIDDDFISSKNDSLKSPTKLGKQKTREFNKTVGAIEKKKENKIDKKEGDLNVQVHEVDQL